MNNLVHVSFQIKKAEERKRISKNGFKSVRIQDVNLLFKSNENIPLLD